VTEWRQWPSWRRLAAIARAPISGPAAAAGSLAAGSLADLVEALEKYAPSAYPEAVQEIADLLLDQQPSLAPLVGLVNAVYLGLDKEPAELAGSLRDMEQRMAESAGVLSAVGAPLVEEGSIVLTHGASGSVRGMLVEAARERRAPPPCLSERVSSWPPIWPPQALPSRWCPTTRWKRRWPGWIRCWWAPTPSGPRM